LRRPVGLSLNLPSRWRHIDSDQEPQSAAASCSSGFVPFPGLARFREMPCGGSAQEFFGGGITHELGDLEAELGLAAMMASVVVAFCSGLYCSCSTRTSKIPAQLLLYAACNGMRCDADSISTPNIFSDRCRRTRSQLCPCASRKSTARKCSLHRSRDPTKRCRRPCSRDGRYGFCPILGAKHIPYPTGKRSARACRRWPSGPTPGIG
jgi:hypothetical protein